MNTVSQNSTVKNSTKSESPKKSVTTGEFIDCLKENPLLIKKSTPSSKQAKRDKESKEKWKNKAVQRATEINTKNKMVAEIRESRDKSKKKLSKQQLRYNYCAVK